MSTIQEIAIVIVMIGSSLATYFIGRAHGYGYGLRAAREERSRHLRQQDRPTARTEAIGNARVHTSDMRIKPPRG